MTLFVPLGKFNNHNNDCKHSERAKRENTAEVFSDARLTDRLRNKDISAVAEVSYFKIRNKWAAVKYTDFLKNGFISSLEAV